MLFCKTTGIFRFFVKRFNSFKYNRLLKQVAQQAHACKIDIAQARSLVNSYESNKGDVSKTQYKNAKAFVRAFERFQKHTVKRLYNNYANTDHLKGEELSQLSLIITADIANTIYKKAHPKERNTAPKREEKTFNALYREVENTIEIHRKKEKAELTLALRNMILQRAEENHIVDRNSIQKTARITTSLLKPNEIKKIIDEVVNALLEDPQPTPAVNKARASIRLGQEKDHYIKGALEYCSIFDTQIDEKGIREIADEVFVLSVDKTENDRITEFLAKITNKLDELNKKKLKHELDTLEITSKQTDSRQKKSKIHDKRKSIEQRLQHYYSKRGKLQVAVWNITHVAFQDSQQRKRKLRFNDQRLELRYYIKDTPDAIKRSKPAEVLL